MQCPAKIIEIITRPDKQYLKIQYKSDKKLQEGHADLYNEKIIIPININSVGAIGIKAVTIATLCDINKLVQSPYMIKQDSL